MKLIICYLQPMGCIININDIKDIFNDNDDQVQINKKLVKKANENGGRDNISLVSVKINA